MVHYPDISQYSRPHIYQIFCFYQIVVIYWVNCPTIWLIWIIQYVTLLKLHTKHAFNQIITKNSRYARNKWINCELESRRNRIICSDAAWCWTYPAYTLRTTTPHPEWKYIMNYNKRNSARGKIDLTLVKREQKRINLWAAYFQTTKWGWINFKHLTDPSCPRQPAPTTAAAVEWNSQSS